MERERTRLRRLAKTKRCSTCHKVKSKTKFSKNKASRYGINYECKKCCSDAKRFKYHTDPKCKARYKAASKKHRESHREKFREYMREYGKRTKKRRREYLVAKLYGLTRQEYAHLVKRCSNRCMICGRRPGKKCLSVDHCKKTKVVRGMLCHCCNLGIGYFKHDVDLLYMAIPYLLDAGWKPLADAGTEREPGCDG